jgi:transcriptional regulator with XRE-family HTH domain
VSEDWAAAARAISERLKYLGWRQRELAERSNVSLAIVREVQRNTTQRRRSLRTLESLSVALGWHPQHLSAVLHNQTPPHVNEPVSAGEESLWSRLDAIERRLDGITDRLENLNTGLTTVLDRLQSDG